MGRSRGAFGSGEHVGLWQVASSTGSSPFPPLCCSNAQRGGRFSKPGPVLRFSSFLHVRWRPRFYLPPASLMEKPLVSAHLCPGQEDREEAAARCALREFPRPGWESCGLWTILACPPFVCISLLERSHACVLLHGPWPCSLGNGRGEQLWQRLHGPSNAKCLLLAFLCPYWMF